MLATNSKNIKKRLTVWKTEINKVSVILPINEIAWGYGAENRLIQYYYLVLIILTQGKQTTTILSIMKFLEQYGKQN